jgi:hypothetical protein
LLTIQLEEINCQQIEHHIKENIADVSNLKSQFTQFLLSGFKINMMNGPDT